MSTSGGGWRSVTTETLRNVDVPAGQPSPWIFWTVGKSGLPELLRTVNNGDADQSTGLGWRIDDGDLPNR